MDVRYLRRLLEWGVGPDEAAALAKSFASLDSKCAICGCSQWWLQRLIAEERSLPGGWRNWGRLAMDHLDPSCRTDGIRLLCYHCNQKRQDGKLTDTQVRSAAFKFWRFWFPDKNLPWLTG